MFNREPNRERRVVTMATTLLLFAVIGCTAAVNVLAQREAGAEAHPQDRARHVVLISVDGLMPARYTEQAPARIPAIRSIMKRGVWADGVSGVLPSVTYPSHTTLITGVRPGDHGIVDNGIFDPEGRSRSGWSDFAADIKVPTLVGAAHGGGLRTAVVQWPVSVGMRADALVPRYFLSSHRQSLTMLKALSTPQLVDSFEAARGRSLSWPLNDDDKAELTVWLLRTQQPHLLLVHLVENDWYHHSHGPDSPEARGALERADGQIARILEGIRGAGLWDRTYVVVVSDHGFAPISQQFQLNALFRTEGLLTAQDDAPSRQVGVKDWRAYFVGSGGTGFVYVRDPHDSATRARVAGLLAQVKADPANGIETVWTQEEIRALGGPPGAAFGVSMREGFYTGGGADVLLAPTTSRAGHGYSPAHSAMNASFVVAGPGIDRQGSLGIVRMTQIAPTIARWLQIGLSPRADGPIEELMESTRTANLFR